MHCIDQHHLLSGQQILHKRSRKSHVFRWFHSVHLCKHFVSRSSGLQLHGCHWVKVIYFDSYFSLNFVSRLYEIIISLTQTKGWYTTAYANLQKLVGLSWPIEIHEPTQTGQFIVLEVRHYYLCLLLKMRYFTNSNMTFSDTIIHKFALNRTSHSRNCRNTKMKDNAAGIWFIERATHLLFNRILNVAKRICW